MDLYAHIRISDDGSFIYQTIKEHSQETARIASESVGQSLKYTAYLAGLLHDMGKCTKEFNKYLYSSVETGMKRKTVIHSFTGVKYILSIPYSNEFGKLAREIIAYAIGAHHGLFDCAYVDNSGFNKRLDYDPLLYSEAVNNFHRCVANEERIKSIFKNSEDEIGKVIGFSSSVKTKIYTDRNNLYFMSGLLARYILSAVINGDRRNTADFMSDCIYKKVSPSKEEWKRKEAILLNELNQIPCDSAINKVRMAFSDEAVSMTIENGIYKLKLPTGAGKTLTSLRLALKCATRNKQRILFVIPLLSILEQNASVIRKYIKDDTWITEHHSNVFNDDDSDHDEIIQTQLHTETWESPIVITTLVQFLNTLFKDKTSCVRRFCSLHDSVIIIDEVQSVPKKMLSLFNEAVNFLAYYLNCTVVLCSATQPCLDEIEHSSQGLIYSPSSDIIKFDRKKWDIFKRCSIVNKCKPNGYELSEIAEFAAYPVSHGLSLLIICNTKKEASGLYENLKNKIDSHVYHLSTGMCVSHRKEVIAELKSKLEATIPVVCVSTQLIEAGVDISFNSVIRIEAGLDNIIQAAGRCNRNGEMEHPAFLYIMNIKGESLTGLPDIKRDQEAFEATVYSINDNDFGSEESLKYYYEVLFRNLFLSNETKFYVKSIECTLFDLLAKNNHRITKTDYILNQAFKTAGKHFEVFDDERIEVLVPYKEGKNIIEDLCSADMDDFWKIETLINQAKAYTVSLFKYEVEKLQKQRGIFEIKSAQILYVTSDFYSFETGIITNSYVEQGFLEV